MSIWSSIFGPKPGEVASVEIRPSGLLMDADGWYYEESLDAECPQRTIRVQQDRPGDWYVRNTNCQVAELNSPSRAAEVPWKRSRTRTLAFSPNLCARWRDAR